MSLQFIRAKPVQACKLVAIVVTLLFAAGGVFGVIPNQGLNSLFLSILVGLGLALVITVETLLAGYRSIDTDDSPTDQVANRPMYRVVRAIEVVSVLVSAGGFIVLIGMLPEGQMAGPGAIGLLFIITGLALLVLVGSLIRTVTEYYNYRQNDAV